MFLCDGSFSPLGNLSPPYCGPKLPTISRACAEVASGKLSRPVTSARDTGSRLWLVGLAGLVPCFDLTYLPHPNPCFAVGSRLYRHWSPRLTNHHDDLLLVVIVILCIIYVCLLFVKWNSYALSTCFDWLIATKVFLIVSEGLANYFHAAAIACLWTVSRAEVTGRLSLPDACARNRR